MKKIPYGEDYYDASYFDLGNKKYRDEHGVEKEWGFVNTSTVAWEGWPTVTKLIIPFKPTNIMEIGSGTSQWIYYLKSLGYDVVGFDFSKYAISHRYRKVSGILRASVTHMPFKDNQFSLTLGTDIFEHIYLDDIPTFLKELYRVSNKWGFYNICTRRGDPWDDGIEFVLKKGELPDDKHEGDAVAGHVSIMKREFWEKELAKVGFKIRNDISKKCEDYLARYGEVFSGWYTLLTVQK